MDRVVSWCNGGRTGAPVETIQRSLVFKQNWLVVSNIFVHPYPGKWSNLTFAYFSNGLKPPIRSSLLWIHQPGLVFQREIWGKQNHDRVLRFCFHQVAKVGEVSSGDLVIKVILFISIAVSGSLNRCLVAYTVIIQLAIYKWYILPIGWLYITYHLLKEPETAIDHMGFVCLIRENMEIHWLLVFLFTINLPGLIFLAKLWVFPCSLRNNNNNNRSQVG